MNVSVGKIGHLYPPSHTETCQTTGQIIDLIQSGLFGTITFSDDDRQLQTWVASNADIEKLFGMMPSAPRDWFPWGATKATMILRYDDHIKSDTLYYRQEVRHVWKRTLGR